MELINRIDAGDDFTTYPTLFTYQDTEITNVTVHGEFNEWAAGYMEQDADGTWTRTLPLEAGTHAYKFVVNGTNWVMDPNTEETKVVDGYTNSAVIVPSAQETVTPQLPE
jgi:1,4-alpha-glucan branching enzyme